MEICIRNKIIVYPVYCERDQYVNGVLKYQKNNWYLCVDNNGMLTRYPKSLGKGKILRGKQLEDPVNKTYEYFKSKIDNL